MKYIITNPGRIQEERPLESEPSGKRHGPVVILQDKICQSMLGFGAALTESACVMLSRMKEEAREALLKEIYSPDEGNFSVGRICVGSSDYAETQYDFAPCPDDMEMRHFDASHDDVQILPILRLCRKYNPDLYLYSSPWSPPCWMKTPGRAQGGWMRQKYIDAYALYYLKFLQYYEKAGVRLNGLTPQNETETDQVSKMPACLWHPEIEMEFAVKMRKLLDENGFKDLKIWLLDHNFIMWRRAIFQMDAPEVKSACAGIAWHPYEGHPEMITWFRNKHPECENHWTEGGVVPIDLVTGFSKKFSIGDIAAGFIKAINNGCQSITVWNLALDPAGYPNIGPFNCKGTIEIDRDGTFVRRSDEYYTLLHFSRYIKRGAKRIMLEPVALPRNFEVSGFVNPDGSKVLFVANTETYDSDLIIRDKDKDIPLRVLRESMNTVFL
jgi:glucosylceramidase